MNHKLKKLIEAIEDMLEFNKECNSSIVLIEKKLNNEYGLDSQDIGLGIPKLEDIGVIESTEVIEGPIEIQKRIIHFLSYIKHLIIFLRGRHTF